MSAVGTSAPVPGTTGDTLFDRFPCCDDPSRRSPWRLKAVLVLFHVVLVGVMFWLSGDLRRKMKEDPLYTSSYFVLLGAVLIQYFYTSGSSPGYVIDAMRIANGTNTTFMSSRTIPKQPASRNSNPSSDRNQLRDTSRLNSSAWLKLVMNLYPPGSSSRNWTCTYCNIIQPPRSKHCQDCDKCVMKFDHHCAWLGTCIGQRNHSRFWWYIFGETMLCTWTGVLYISFLRSNVNKACYLVLTNQTTYELVRKRRILYLRGIPDGLHPFSHGFCRNMRNFCCPGENMYSLEPPDDGRVA